MKTILMMLLIVIGACAIFWLGIKIDSLIHPYMGIEWLALSFFQQLLLVLYCILLTLALAFALVMYIFIIIDTFEN
jgi:hypothetical protein